MTKWLSVEMLINKEESGIYEWDFELGLGIKLGLKLGKWLKIKGFDDMVYDMGLDWVKLGFCLILLGILRVRFLSSCVDESAIWISEKTSCCFSF